LAQFSAVYYEQNEEKKKELREKLYSSAVPQNLDFLERLLEKSKSQYFAGEELSYADLAVMSALERMGDKKDSLLESRPLIKAVDERVRSSAKVAEWLEKRPKTEM
jgi:glutathione S-transferase